MAAHAIPSVHTGSKLHLTACGQYRGLRVLAWDRNVLYASRDYALLRSHFSPEPGEWEEVARFQPDWLRRATSTQTLSARLMRDGFHALAVLPTGHLVAAVPGHIVTLAPGEHEFCVTQELLRGTRPLHIAATPDGRLYWGEYFDNPARDEVHIYASLDSGATWNIAYTFAPGAIRHIHNIVYDEVQNCLWILTGDNAAECRILRASTDLSTVDVVLAGGQQARAVALVPAADGLYFASDTPLDSNHVYRLTRRGELALVADLPSSSIYGCRVGDSVFFSTLVEPSRVNRDRHVHISGSADAMNWTSLLRWKKDRWSMKYFQYGNAFLPDGTNATNYLALTTVATTEDDQTTFIYRVEVL
jgi:hypothetical protein